MLHVYLDQGQFYSDLYIWVKVIQWPWIFSEFVIWKMFIWVVERHCVLKNPLGQFFRQKDDFHWLMISASKCFTSDISLWIVSLKPKENGWNFCVFKYIFFIWVYQTLVSWTFCKYVSVWEFVVIYSSVDIRYVTTWSHRECISTCQW